MILTVGDILELAEKKGLSRKDIMSLSGRTGVTLWRWERHPDRGFDLDAGMRKLIRALGDG